MKNNFLSKEQMEKLTTKRLLAYKKKLMSYRDIPDLEDNDPDQITKSHPDWIKAYDEIKTILANREHVVRKGK